MSIVIDDCVAIDAGSLAFACTKVQRENVRDIILTHTHLDHIAGLPLFIDDLFSKLTEPIRVHATREMIEILERDIFNWSIYPRFSELSNDSGPVIEYVEIKSGSEFQVKHLGVRNVPVNHSVSAAGYLVGDGATSVGITGDTAETEEIWSAFHQTPDLKAVLVDAHSERTRRIIQCRPSFDADETRARAQEIERFGCPGFRDKYEAQVSGCDSRADRGLARTHVEIMEVGKVYNW